MIRCTNKEITKERADRVQRSEGVNFSDFFDLSSMDNLSRKEKRAVFAELALRERQSEGILRKA